MKQPATWISRSGRAATSWFMKSRNSIRRRRCSDGRLDARHVRGIRNGERGSVTDAEKRPLCLTCDREFTSEDGPDLIAFAAALGMIQVLRSWCRM